MRKGAKQAIRRAGDGPIELGAAAAAHADAAAARARQAVKELSEKMGKEIKVSKLALGREIAKAKFLEATGRARSSAMTSLKEICKETAVADPEMWPCARALLVGIIEGFWTDLELEVERKLAEAVLRQQANNDKTCEHSGWCCCCRRVRAFFLHHWLPHDRSVFGKFNDPVFLALALLSCLPIYCIRVSFFSVMLCCIMFPGPPDEFQLIQFILSLKGSQFLTAGILQILIAALSYFWCASRRDDELATCIRENGPGSFDSLWFYLADYLGSVVLAWLAFAALPRSVNSRQGKFLGREASAPGEASSRCACLGEADKTRGGRLRKLLKYDMVCFLISFIGLAALCSTTRSHPQLKANVFWCKTLYSLMTLPFTFFLVPILRVLLTHSDRTGYNEHGVCVAFQLPVSGRRCDDASSTESDSDSGCSSSGSA